jgi:formate dehydrogenase subunit gamma
MTESRKTGGIPREFVRFSRSQRIEHAAVMVSFIALLLTGVPQKFSDASWAQSAIVMMGGIETVRLVHRTFALLLVLETVYHVGSVLASMVRGGFVPSMIPGLKDVRDALMSFKYCIGLTSETPKFGRFDYRQKFEYWGVALGVVIMITTGMILMFPTQATQLLPGLVVPASREMHGGEALLVLGIFVGWHLYGAHLNPIRFPGDLSIFTGRISRERMMAEHPLEYARIVRKLYPEHEEEFEIIPPRRKEEHPSALPEGASPLD